jgi:(p)ppGpp synthase/HD superfamily hydrolase
MIAPMDTDSSSALLVKAADFAARKHIDQKRKGKGQPYIVHPIGVARILSAEADIQEPLVLAAAMLHDTIEDTDATEAELRAEFGDEITDVVLEVSDDKSLPKAARKRAQIDHAPHMSREATLVKMADKLYNLRDLAEDPPPHWSPARVSGYFVWAHHVIEALSDVHPGLRSKLREVIAPRVPASAEGRREELESYLASLPR